MLAPALITPSTKSPWKIVTARVHLSIPPQHASNIAEAASRQAYTNLLLRHNARLGGVIVAHDGPLKLTRPPAIVGSSPFLHIRARARLLIFAPEVGTILSGRVSHIGPDHAGLFVHGSFHAVLPIDETPYMYDHDTGSRWTGSPSDPDDEVTVGRHVRFAVASVKATKSGLFQLVATIQVSVSASASGAHKLGLLPDDAPGDAIDGGDIIDGDDIMASVDRPIADRPAQKLDGEALLLQSDSAFGSALRPAVSPGTFGTGLVAAGPEGIKQEMPAEGQESASGRKKRGRRRSADDDGEPEPKRSRKRKERRGDRADDENASVAKPMDEDASVAKPVDEDASVAKPIDEDASIAKPVDEDANVAKPMDEDASIAKPVDEDASVAKPVDEDANVAKPMDEDASIAKPVDEDASVAMAVDEDSDCQIEFSSKPTVVVGQTGVRARKPEARISSGKSFSMFADAVRAVAVGQPEEVPEREFSHLKHEQVEVEVKKDEEDGQADVAGVGTEEQGETLLSEGSKSGKKKRKASGAGQSGDTGESRKKRKKERKGNKGKKGSVSAVELDRRRMSNSTAGEGGYDAL